MFSGIPLRGNVVDVDGLVRTSGPIVAIQTREPPDGVEVNVAAYPFRHPGIVAGAVGALAGVLGYAIGRMSRRGR